MPKSRSKKKYKKKKNPNRAPQQNKQNGVTRTQSAKSGRSGAKPAPADPNRQKQMWIAVAVAVGVFLLLLLIAQLSNNGGKDAAPASSDAETVEDVGNADSADETNDADGADEAATDADAQDTDTDTNADNSAETNADSADETDADSGKTDNAATTTDNTTATTTDSTNSTTSDSDVTAPDSNATTSDSNVTENDSNAATSDNGNSEPSDAQDTDAASLQSADADAPAAVQYADILVQDYGKITVELDATAAPVTVQNFVDLAKSGFYNGLTFHRIMDGFMAQGGDPKGDGTGGADKNIVGEFASNGYTNNLSHTRGTISMARASNDKNSASSQFFIVQKDSTFLDGDYAAFGHVTEGMEIVDKICKDAKPTDDNGSIAPDEQPIIESITIREQ